MKNVYGIPEIFMRPLIELTAQGWIETLTRKHRAAYEQFLHSSRWFRSKKKKIQLLKIFDDAAWQIDDQCYLFWITEGVFEDGTEERYLSPLVVEEMVPKAENASNKITIPHEGKTYTIRDALRDIRFETWLFRRLATAEDIPMRYGKLRVMPKGDLKWLKDLRPEEIKNMTAEQSNTSVVLQSRSIFKFFRKLEPAISPEVEMLDFFRRRHFCFVPPLELHWTYEDGKWTSTVGLLQGFVPNRGDGWQYALEVLDGFYERFAQAPQASQDTISQHLEECLARFERLGEVTGLMHRTLASEADDENFRPEEITAADLELWKAHYLELLDTAFEILRQKVEDKDCYEEQTTCQWLLAREQAARAATKALALMRERGVKKIRYHGDYHLGQTLRGKDWVLYDFEGEPLRDVKERKQKGCPLKDVGGLLRSFNYAVHVSRRRFEEKKGKLSILKELGGLWEKRVRLAFLQGYWRETYQKHAIFLSPAFQDNLAFLKFYELEKVLYELNYEWRNRPDWISVPLQGMKQLLGKEASL